MSRLALLWFIGSLPAQTWVEFEGRAWFSQVNSRIRVERNTLGTEIDAKNDLGFTNSNFPEGRASLHVGNSRFSFEYTPIDFSGDRIVSRTLIFNGNTYTLGTRVVSGLEVRHLQLGWTYQFHLLRRRVKLGPLVEAQSFLLSGHLRAPDVNVDSREEFSAGLPTLGRALEISPNPRLDLYGETAGMTAGGYGHFLRSEAGVRFRPLRRVHLTAGYRTFNLRVADSQDFAHLRLRGPFLGAGFRW